MTKILININGEQKLIEVGEGGGVTSDAEVLWNEQIHGPMPSIELGKMEAYDELEDLEPAEYVPELDENNEVVLDENGDVVFTDVKLQHLVHKLRVLADVIPSHAEKLAEEQQIIINAEARAYLAATDWFIIRELDEGTACPEEIKLERAAARARIVE